MGEHGGIRAIRESAEILELRRLADEQLLAFYSPAALTVTKSLRVVDTRGNLERFGLAIACGRVVRGKIAGSLRRLLASGTRADETLGDTRLTVLPLPHTEWGGNFFCVLVEAAGEHGGDRVEELEQQLGSTRNYLASLLDESEDTTEELRSALEELKAANEELQHVNAELGTANHGLTALNARLTDRSSELERTHAELANVVSSLGIPMVIVGMDLRIRRFTPQAERLFNVRPGHSGRLVAELNPALPLPSLEAACMRAIESFRPQMQQVRDEHGRGYTFVARPYRTEQKQLEGVVLALYEAAPGDPLGL